MKGRKIEINKKEKKIERRKKDRQIDKWVDGLMD